MDISDVSKQNEGQCFDRKRAQIAANKLADCVMSFANADGGTIAVGVEDDGTPSGFEGCPDKESKIREVLLNYITPPMRLKFSKIPFENNRGVDFVLLITVEPSVVMHENQAKKVTLRVGRQVRYLKYDEIQHLQFDKNLQRFESGQVKEATLADLDADLVSSLGLKIKTSDQEQILVARDLVTRTNDSLDINFAGILLFGTKPQKWIERARVRIIKYEGTKEETGTNLNIIKDLSFEKSLIDQLEEGADTIKSLLREFTKLDPDTGKFVTIFEYPPFAWKEALVNAVTHREYALSGVDIQIKIFDDRLEIISPGNFPSTIREDNIKDAHFSRNPKIARVLGDFGYVRELGEGVNRIYHDMSKAGLPEPSFKNPSGSVIVTLKNDIAHRKLRKYSELKSKIPVAVFESLNTKEQEVVLYVLENEKITKREVSSLIGMSPGTSIGVLKNLQEKKPPVLLVVRKFLQDPKAHYILNPEVLVQGADGIITPSASKPEMVQKSLFWNE